MNAQKATKSTDPVIAEIGKTKITASELENAFKKNMSRTTDNLFKMSKDSILDFINLYTNFKLKVIDAVQRGMLKDSSVISEIKQNRRILSESFYYDKMLTEKNVDKFLKMREKEYQVAIILAAIKQTVDVIDTTEAYRKITTALERIKNGADFADVARATSDDYETGKFGGLISNYVTSGKVQRPIEDAIYSTKPGDIYPEVIKTSYGYFLLKVLDESERLLVKGRHILVGVDENRDSTTAYHKADSLLKLIKSGADFSKLAKENSDDLTTAVNGGDMGGYYSRSTGMQESAYPLVTEFESVLYGLKDGQISGVVYTNYGAHIIRRDSTKLPDFNAEKDELRRLYKRLYFKEDQTKLLDSLRNLYKFKLYDDVLYQFASFLDTNGTNLADNWDSEVPERIKNNVIYEVLGKNVKVSKLIELLKEDQKLRGANLNPSGLVAAIYSIVESVVFDEATKNLEKDYVEFDHLMKEFSDGILLFKVEAQEVWDKMKFDTVLAKTYYDSTKSRYLTQDAYDVSEIYFLDKKTADSVYKRIIAGENFDDVANKETQRSGYRDKKGHWGFVNVKTNSLARHAHDMNAKAGQVLEPVLNEPGYSIILVNAHQPPRPKTFEEAIPDFSAQYQEILQSKLLNQWLNSVRKKNPVKINEAELNKLLSEK
ncbi:MAG: peptidylprolyl isomerase [Ignavibacteriae bacterium]|nr:peptidylprolyl isomerase [Ignavibacteriota bacterium]